MCPRPTLPEEERRIPFRATTVPDDQAWMQMRVGLGRRWYNEAALLAEAVELMQDTMGRVAGLRGGSKAAREGLLLGICQGLRQNRAGKPDGPRERFWATSSPGHRVWLDQFVGPGKLWANDSAFLEDAFSLLRLLHERLEAKETAERDAFFAGLFGGVSRAVMRR